MIEAPLGPRVEPEIAEKAQAIIDNLRSVVEALAPIEKDSSFSYSLGNKKIFHNHAIPEGDTLAELLRREDFELWKKDSDEIAAEKEKDKINLAVARIALGQNASLLDLPPRALANRRLPLEAEVKSDGSFKFFCDTTIPGLKYQAYISHSTEYDHDVVALHGFLLAK